MKFLLAHGADPNVRGESGVPLEQVFSSIYRLCLRARADQIALIEILIEAGAKYTDDALLAIRRGQLEDLQRHLNAKPNLIEERFENVFVWEDSFAPVNGGETWSDYRLDPTLVEPVCQASFLRYSLASSNGKNRLLFSDPVSAFERQEFRQGDHCRTERHNLVVRLSYDEGKTWPVHVLPSCPTAILVVAMRPENTRMQQSTSLAFRSHGSRVL